jgi:hypothetical protein
VSSPDFANEITANLRGRVAYSAFLDLALTLLPWKLLWGLSILKKEKFGIILAMSMGIL